MNGYSVNTAIVDEGTMLKMKDIRMVMNKVSKYNKHIVEKSIKSLFNKKYRYYVTNNKVLDLYKENYSISYLRYLSNENDLFMKKGDARLELIKRKI